MKLGIMQPYFFPYIGYWQLMHAVDCYVVYDDVNYIKGGWINRNHILCGGGPYLITLPLQGASPNKKINGIEVEGDSRSMGRMLRTIQESYAKAPFCDVVYPILASILKQPEKNLGLFLYHAIKEVAAYLGISTKLCLSSALQKNDALTAEDKVIHICEMFGATEYLNAIGGTDLYVREHFSQKNIALRFLKTKPVVYKQFGPVFEPNLSIIDIMMFNAPEQIKTMLDSYELV